MPNSWKASPGRETVNHRPVIFKLSNHTKLNVGPGVNVSGFKKIKQIANAQPEPKKFVFDPNTVKIVQRTQPSKPSLNPEPIATPTTVRIT